MVIKMKKFAELIYSPESATGEALSKVESHTPKIIAPDKVKANEEFKIKISVGPHPNTVEHSIRKIEIYIAEKTRKFNPILVASIDLVPIYSEPELEIKLKLKETSTIYAIAYCNLHGLWENRKEIIVED